MRKDGIPYVQNPKNFYPPVDPMKLPLDELISKYLKNCGKSNGDPAVCSRCQTPCDIGRRACQLKALEVYNDPPVPLYGGKTLIEKAREENILRKQQKEEKKAEENKKTKNHRKYIRIENWYEKAMASEDPVSWVAENYQVSRTKAKQRLYDWKNNHPEVNKEKVVEETNEPVKEVVAVKTDGIESKLEKLMKMQEDQKKAMDEYYRLYEQAKVEYEKIKEKTDILCNAMDILNDI